MNDYVFGLPNHKLQATYYTYISLLLFFSSPFNQHTLHHTIHARTDIHSFINSVRKAEQRERKKTWNKSVSDWSKSSSQKQWKVIVFSCLIVQDKLTIDKPVSKLNHKAVETTIEYFWLKIELNKGREKIYRRKRIRRKM